MRVAFDVGPVRDQPTGVGIFTVSMARALALELPRGELVLIGRHSAAGSGLPSQARSLEFRGPGYITWLQGWAARDVKRAGAAIAHFSDGMTPVLRHGRTVVSIHDMSVVRSWRTHPTRRLLRIPFALMGPHLADLVVVPSKATADEVMRLTGTDAAKIEVAPYAAGRETGPVDDETTAAVLASYGLHRNEYILALGTIEPRKNHVRLVEAFEVALRSKAIPLETDLVVVGHAGWHAGPIIRRMDDSPNAGQIRRLGYVKEGDVDALLTGAAAVAYPSLYEGFGLPVVEAMRCGAATVTSNISSMPEVAGAAGFLVDPYDSSDIARGLAEAFSAHTSDTAAVERESRAQAANFTWKRTAAIVVDLYRTRLF